MNTYLALARRRLEIFVGIAAAASLVGCGHTAQPAPTPAPIVQTPADRMALPGQPQPVQLPPGIRPGITYQPSQGSLDPFTALDAPTDPQPPAPTPPPDAPKCVTYGGQPLPHLRLLPCGWDWDGYRWTQTASAPITPTNLAQLLGAE